MIDTLRAGDEEVDRTLLVVGDQLPVVQARHDQPADAVAAGTVIVATLAGAKPNSGADTRVILSYPAGRSARAGRRLMCQFGCWLVHRLYVLSSGKISTSNVGALYQPGRNCVTLRQPQRKYAR